MRVAELVSFIVARDSIRQRRELRLPKPWTKDPILQQWRFCNVHREHDKVTKWIAENWRDPNKDDPDLWFAMAVARWNNHPDTLAEIGYPVPYNPNAFEDACNRRKVDGKKVWTGAYMIGTQGNAKDKPAFIAHDVLGLLWSQRERLRPAKNIRLDTFANRLSEVLYQGKFMVGQIVADAKYADKHLLKSPDWWTFAISGPGSRRGMNRVLGRRLTQPWKEADWFDYLTYLRGEVNRRLGVLDMVVEEGAQNIGPLHGQDLQNCLCEFDKYERARLQQGKPRAKYKGV